MRRTWLVLAFVASGLAISTTALAQSSSDCPGGGWFCSDTDGATPPPSDAEPSSPSGEGKTAPSSSGEAPRTPRAAPAGPRPHGAPTVYVPAQGSAQGAPPAIIYQPVVTPPPPPYPPPPPPLPVRRMEWGLQGRVSAALLGGNAAHDSGLVGLGASLRPRPFPHFAIDLGGDLYGGTDYQGNKRTEASFTINPMVFLNPGRRVQVYLLTGVGFSTASVDLGTGSDVRYTYVGLDAGAGLEFRLGPHWALSGDLVGFIRGRTDPNARDNPEFVEAGTGRKTNTSGGALMRGGLTFYW